MPNPRDVNIDVVGHDHTDRATKSAERNLDSLERKLAKVDRATGRSAVAAEDLQKRWKRSFETGPIGTKLESLSGKLLKITGGAAAAVPALGALQPVIVGLTGVLAPAAAALGVFGGVLGSVFGEVSDASAKNQDLLDKIQLAREKARVLTQRGDKEGAAKELEKAAKAAVELRARYSLLDPAVAQAVDRMDQLKMTWQDFIDKNTPRTVELLVRGFELLIRTIPKLQPLFDAGADAAERFLGFIERKEADGTIDRFITFLADKAPGALETVAGALDRTWGALQTAWQWWGNLSTAVSTAVDNIRTWVLGMRLNWYSTLGQMYADSASFLREAAEAFGQLPGVGEKVRTALLKAASGLDESARKAREKAAEIQNAIDSIHDHSVTVTVNTHYKNFGTPAGTVVPSWYGKAPGGDAYGGHTGSAGQDVLMAAPGSRSTMPPMPITVAAPDVSVNVTIPGLAQVLTAMVRSEVGRAQRASALRAQFGRAV
jgi:hypothetical protein